MIDLLRPISQLTTAIFVVVAALSHAQTAPLNDTGQSSCYDASNIAVTCDAATAGNTGTRPHQDGRYGRDAAAAAGVFSKVGGGVEGFDFSCVLWNGTVINGPNCQVGLLLNTSGTPSATPSTDWACTRDNVTGLVWSLQTLSARWLATTNPTFADAGHNTPARCGAITLGSSWRMPTRRELFGLVHHGVTTGPRIDIAYFSGTQPEAYMAREGISNSSGVLSAWGVHFGAGTTATLTNSSSWPIRLVRGAP